MKYFCSLQHFVKVFFHCGTRAVILGTILVGFQPHSEDIVRPRTRDDYEHQRQRNHNKPARYKTLRDWMLRPNISSHEVETSKMSLIFLFSPHCVCVRPPQPHAHDYENVNSGYGYSDHPGAPRAPARSEAAHRGMKPIWKDWVYLLNPNFK